MKYSAEFKCLKEKCPHNCCSNTEVKLSVIDLIKIKDLLGLHYENLNYKFDKHSAHAYFDIRTGYPYAVMNNKNSSCPLLNNGLCVIHKRTITNSRVSEALKSNDLSTSALPLICRSYPLAIFYPETGKLGLNSGCKRVDGMKWEYVSKTPQLEEVTHEVSVYQALMKKLSNHPTNQLIKLLNNNTFFDKVLETLESIKKDDLEKVSFL